MESRHRGWRSASTRVIEQQFGHGSSRARRTRPRIGRRRLLRERSSRDIRRGADYRGSSLASVSRAPPRRTACTRERQRSRLRIVETSRRMTPVAAYLRPVEWVNAASRTLSGGRRYSPKLDVADSDPGGGPAAEGRSCFACLLLSLEQDDREALTVGGALANSPRRSLGRSGPLAGCRSRAHQLPPALDPDRSSMSQGLRARSSPFAAGGFHCQRVGLGGDAEVIVLPAVSRRVVANGSQRA